MHLRALSIENFRNLAQVTLEPHPRFNIFSGDNGQGKTNLLEAAYLLATLRSFRTTHTEELLRLGADGAPTVLRARVDRLGTERLLSVELTRAQASSTGRGAVKVARVDGKAARVVDYFGGVNAVLFSPDDLRLPKGPPSGRRRLLDRAVWNAAPAFLAEAQTYDRLLRSRNALLRDNLNPRRRPPPVAARESYPSVLPQPEELLAVFDYQLAAAGAALLSRRLWYLDLLSPYFEMAFARVSQSGLRATLRYRVAGTCLRSLLDAASPSKSFADADLREALDEQLRRDQARDRARGFTHSGPHADDLEFLLDDQPAAQYASQGQLRALVLAFKIAEIRLLLARLHDTPVLLLDDVSSELDAARNQNLFTFLQEVPCQALITTTSPDYIQLPRGDGRRDFRVQGGFIDAVG